MTTERLVRKASGMTTGIPTFGRDLIRKPHPDPSIGGDWWEAEFANGYGASIVRNRRSYGGPEGKFEVAVTHGGPLCYATSVTSGVLGWLSEADVGSTLDAIERLPINGNCGHWHDA